jgi:cytochrome P450
MTTEPAAGEILYNPFDPSFRADPYAVYRRLREEAPVHKSPLGFFVLTRYEDCANILRDPRSSNDFTQSTGAIEEAAKRGIDLEQLAGETTPPFLFMDPPDHTRLRGLVSKAFTPRVVEALRPRAQAIVDELLDAAVARGEIDVIADLAYPLPVTIISEMLGVPAEDHQVFQGWSREMARSLDPDFVLPADVLERRQKAGDEFAEYFRGLIAKRRTDLRDDLVSALIAAEDGGQTLSENELLSTCILLLIAGHETTVNLIGNGMLALLRNPEQLARLRDDPSLIKTAVEELLRFDPPVQLTGRTAKEDLPLSDGVLPKGQQAILLLGAANRDPLQFSDPERLDIAREENRHLAFGMGIHFCLGAPLARIEGQIAIGEMVRRLRAPELAVAEPEYKENVTLRGLASLPVRFSA